MELAKDAVKLFDRIMAGPIGRSIVAEDAAAQLARRKELIAKKAASETALAKKLPGLQKAEREAAAACEKARAGLAEATQAHARATLAERSARSAADRESDTIEAELRQSASPRIAAFLEDLDKSVAKVRMSGPAIELEDGRPGIYLNYDTEPTRKGDLGASFKHTVIPNGGWMELALRVRREASELWREALDEQELAARLAGLTAQLQVEQAA